MTWRVAVSLEQLLHEVNGRWPSRSRASDGTIGDAAHARSTSDHNPWVKDRHGVGVVTAVDITTWAEPDVPDLAAFIVARLVQRRDPRVKYLIHNRTMWRSYARPGIPPWSPAPYNGSNPHTSHLHVSVLPEEDRYDDASSWGVFPPPWWHRIVHAPLRGPDVAMMARYLERLGYPCGTPLDVCGPRMSAAIEAFAHAAGLPPHEGGTAQLAARLEVAHHH